MTPWFVSHRLTPRRRKTRRNAWILLAIAAVSYPACVRYRTASPEPPSASARLPSGEGSLLPAPPSEQAFAGEAGTPSEADAALEASIATSTPVPAAELELEVEPPYKLYERPIPKGDVYAAGLEEQLARWNLGGNGDQGYPSNRPGFHPGTRVLVELVSVRGKLPIKTPHTSTGRARKILAQDGLLAQVRKYGYWPFRLCFEEGLRKDPKLGGATRLRLRVTPSGRVARARLVQTEVKEARTAACLVERAERLTFAPGPPRAIDAVFDLKISPGDARLPERGPPPSEALDDDSGRFDAAAIARAIAVFEEPIRRCFAQGHARDPELWGRLELRIDVNARGSCDRISEHDSRFPDAEVRRCVIAAFQNAQFPGTGGGVPLRFIQAFRLGHLPMPVEAPPAIIPVGPGPSLPSIAPGN